ncbi:MAG: hypothetical protein ACREA7_06980 [Nitrosotalea sp.]
MKALPKSIIIAICCFCAADLVLIQSDFFISCYFQPRDSSPLHPTCDTVVRSLNSVFGMSANIALAAIVGITAYYSPKKSAIIVLVLVGLYLSDIVLWKTYLLSIDAIHATNSGIMRPMTITEMVMHNVVYSPLWWIIQYAMISSAVTWFAVVLRNKMRKSLL